MQHLKTCVMFYNRKSMLRFNVLTELFRSFAEALDQTTPVLGTEEWELLCVYQTQRTIFE